MVNNPIWSFKDTSWEQDDDSKTFRIRRIQGQQCEQEPFAPLDLLIGAKRHLDFGTPCEESFFPQDFQNCPYCGSKLLDSNNYDDHPWIPPYGPASGLKVFPKELAITHLEKTIEEQASKFPLPAQEGYFAFCAAKLGAQRRLLIALQRDSGRLWVYNPGLKHLWTELEGVVGECSLPAWSWSIAMDSSENTLCVPSEQGPVSLTVNWASNSINLIRAEGHSIGGTARLGDYLLAPVIRGEHLVIVSKKEDENMWRDCTPISDSGLVLQKLTQNSLNEAFLGIPVIQESKQIVYWSCREGYIRVSAGGESNGLSWEFKRFEKDGHPATALVELGPPYKKAGKKSGIWQLCESHDPDIRDGIVNTIIEFDGDSHLDWEEVKCGQFLTTGDASFSWADDHWHNIHKREQRIGAKGELHFPLIQFGSKGLVLIAKVAPWEGRDEFGVFTDIFFQRHVRTNTFVRFVLEGSGFPEKALFAKGLDGALSGERGSLFRVGLAQCPEISAFVYDESLYIYLPERNECFFWPIKLMEK